MISPTVIIFMLSLMTFQSSNCSNVPYIDRVLRNSNASMPRQELQRSFVFQPGTRFRIKPELLLLLPEFDEIPIETGLRLRMPVLDYFYIARPSARNFDHTEILSYVENSLDTAGLHGKACISRVICETMQIPKHSLGFFGELVDKVCISALQNSNFQLRYKDAFKEGLTYGNCGRKFSECPSLFGL